MKFTTIYFDLDATLYPESNGLWPEIRKRIDLFMHEEVGIAWSDIKPLREKYYLQYGTTLNGLQKNYGVDASKYLTFVHDLPLERYIQPDSILRKTLLSLSQDLWIFTNADADHASRVIDFLNISDCFKGIIDVLAIAPYCKPQKEAYIRALSIVGEYYPNRCIFFDDSPSNLATARELGFFSVLVGQKFPNLKADRTILYLRDLIKELPELF